VDAQPATPYVPPTPRTAKTLGVLNLVIGGLLVLGGACCGLSWVMTPFMNRGMEEATRKTQAQAAETRKARIEALEHREKTAQTEEDKQQAKAEREKLEAEKEDVTLNFSFQMDMGWQTTAYFAAEMVTGLILNIALMVAGVGLIRLAHWGRTLSLWVAGLKLAYLLILNAVLALVVAPELGRKFGEYVDRQMESVQRMAAAKGQPAAPMVLPKGQMGMIYAVYFMIYAVLSVFIGAIYPAILLWLLNTPGVRAACAGPKPALEPGWEAP
jgi:hypothetical protein